MSSDVKNVMEIIVDTNLDSALNSMHDVCRCEKCIADIKAIVLNKMKPMYVSTHMGEVIGKLQVLDPHKRVEFLCCVNEAVEKVRNNPHHD
ncbi:MAG: late competence development ComFB family protein [Anaerovibrio sp.]|uniref:late competence development ComFB family protein n=1 Tax=Anaerovibrio sp. TaxID=1872532 RepID=UPI0025E3BE50|nr:late competence development ComFB family protein [Anaerovibrio sp.]MCR5175788.1 late competence development ComFB family protein [Anaerovibrio sp.]